MPGGHVSDTSTVLDLAVLPSGRLAVDQHPRIAACDRVHVGATAGGVDSLVADRCDRQAVKKHLGAARCDDRTVDSLGRIEEIDREARTGPSFQELEEASWEDCFGVAV